MMVIENRSGAGGTGKVDPGLGPIRSASSELGMPGRTAGRPILETAPAQLD